MRTLTAMFVFFIMAGCDASGILSVTCALAAGASMGSIDSAKNMRCVVLAVLEICTVAFYAAAMGCMFFVTGLAVLAFPTMASAASSITVLDALLFGMTISAFAALAFYGHIWQTTPERFKQHFVAVARSRHGACMHAGSETNC